MEVKSGRSYVNTFLMGKVKNLNIGGVLGLYNVFYMLKAFCLYINL